MEIINEAGQTSSMVTLEDILLIAESVPPPSIPVSIHDIAYFMRSNNLRFGGVYESEEMTPAQLQTLHEIVSLIDLPNEEQTNWKQTGF